VVTALLLGATACGNESGTGGTLQAAPEDNTALSGPAAKAPKSVLAGLIALPRGYVADSRNTTGPFTATTFLSNWSADPALDRALLLNASFVDGYRATRLSPDRKKRFTVQLFKAGSAAKARTLQKGFWNQETHENPFDVPGALSDASVDYDGGAQQNVATAESSLVVGNLLVELTVQESAPIGTGLKADTGLIIALTKQQHTRLTTTSS
jgi:hypothetical protein